MVAVQVPIIQVNMPSHAPEGAIRKPINWPMAAHSMPARGPKKIPARGSSAVLTDMVPPVPSSTTAGSRCALAISADQTAMTAGWTFPNSFRFLAIVTSLFMSFFACARAPRGARALPGTWANTAIP